MSEDEEKTVKQHRCYYPPPQRVWTQTEDGWTSREWERGEQLAYAREVLGQ